MNSLNLLGPRLELLSADKRDCRIVVRYPEKAVIVFLFRFFLQDTRRQIPEDCSHQGFFLFNVRKGNKRFRLTL